MNVNIRSDLHRIDLNADLAEGCPWDLPLLAFLSSASLSCGFHAGNHDSIRATAEAALARRVILGAHPGYPDRTHFGREPRNLSAAQVESLILEQVHALADLLKPLGAAIAFLKPHGALYNQAQREPEIAHGVLAAATRLGPLPLLLMPRSLLIPLADQLPNPPPLYGEGFIDRAYQPDGSLRPRSLPDAILTNPDQIAAQTLHLIHQPEIATLCLHGDDLNALHHAPRLHALLTANHIAVRNFLEP